MLQTPGAYQFIPQGSVISYVFSRGYSYESVPAFKKISGDYLFPVAYPDWNLGRWYYLKRIYSSVFFDSTQVEDVLTTETLDSYGAEVYSESHVLSFLATSLQF